MIKIRIVKRVMSILLVISITIGLLTSSEAARVILAADEYVDDIETVKNINLQINGKIAGIDNPNEPSTDSEWKGSKVYFGSYAESTDITAEPVLFRVLDKNTTDYNSDSTMFLDCDSILKSVKFYKNTSSNDWSQSLIRTWMNGSETEQFLYNFTDVEKNAIVESSRADFGGSADESVVSKYGNLLQYCPLDKEKVFELDVKEATNSNYGYTGNCNSVDNRSKVRFSGDNSLKQWWWLRSSSLNKSGYVGIIYSDGSIDHRDVTSTTTGVSPAMNINLSEILFSTAKDFVKSSELAQVGEDKVTSNKWSLTLKDSSKNVAVQNDKIVIKRIQDGKSVVTVPYVYTGKNVNQISIMITSKEYDSENSEVLYYGKLDTQEVFEEHNESYTGLGTGTFIIPIDMPDTAKMYILAENINEGNYTDYASEPYEIDPFMEQYISDVNISGVDQPLADNDLDITAACDTNGIWSLPVITWEKKKDDGSYTYVSGKAEYNTTYRMQAELKTQKGYKYSDSSNVIFNGEQVTNVVYDSDREVLSFSKEYTTAKSKLLSIGQDNSYSVKSGVALTDMNIPVVTSIITEGNIKTEASVDWHIDNPTFLNDTSFEKSDLSGQVFILEGDVNCPADIDTNNLELKTKITITVSAADFVPEPVSNLISNTYLENEIAELSTSLEGSNIYYTITSDGTEPSDPTNGDNLYTSAIKLDGISGKSITYKIKAFATKEGFQNSKIVTFNYVIAIPAVKYDVVVTGGTGSGKYEEGQIVTITAEPQSGKQLSTWEGLGEVVYIDGTNEHSETVKFIMPDKALNVSAVYEDIPHVHIWDSKWNMDSTSHWHNCISDGCDITDNTEKKGYGNHIYDDDNDTTCNVCGYVRNIVPYIVRQPDDILSEEGYSITFTTEASANPTPQYQWMVDKNDGNGFVNIDNAVNKSYSIRAVNKDYDGYRFKCVVYNSEGSVESRIVILNVEADQELKEIYKIIEGADLNINLKNDNEAVIKCDGDNSKFLDAYVDDNLLKKNQYNVNGKLTTITLKEELLKTLDEGRHLIKLVYTDGYAETNFIITKGGSVIPTVVPTVETTEAVTEETTSTATTEEETIPEETKPTERETTLEETKPTEKETTPEETKSTEEETIPEETKPTEEETTPEETKSTVEETTPNETKQTEETTSKKATQSEVKTTVKAEKVIEIKTEKATKLMIEKSTQQVKATGTALLLTIKSKQTDLKVQAANIEETKYEEITAQEDTMMPTIPIYLVAETQQNSQMESHTQKVNNMENTVNNVMIVYDTDENETIHNNDFNKIPVVCLAVICFVSGTGIIFYKKKRKKY